MSDELQVRDLVAHLYTAANELRPDAWAFDATDPATMKRTLDYLVQHARATEGALRKIGQLMDEMRVGPQAKGAGDKDDIGGGAAPEARKPGAAG